MIIDDVDCGPGTPSRAMTTGYAKGHNYGPFTFPLAAPFALGGSAANSPQACEYLAAQLQELCSNPLRPLHYIQFQSGSGVIRTSADDGWYKVSDLAIAKTGLVWQGFMDVTFSLEFVAVGMPERIGVHYTGGALASDYSGAAQPWLAFPPNSTVYDLFNTRAAADGAIPMAFGSSIPNTNPNPFTPGATIADLFAGSCRAFDAMAPIATNPVPTTAGTYTNANWVEVKGPKHKFVGDIIITNGLWLFVVSVNGSGIAHAYVWGSALASPKWLDVGIAYWWDNGVTFFGTARQCSLVRLTPEDVTLRVQSSNGGGMSALHRLRLQRGSLTPRLDFKPQSQAGASNYALYIATAANVKAVYNETTAWDIVGGASPIGGTAVYGYGAAILTPGATYPFILGFLYQKASTSQPVLNGATSIAIGDNGGPPQNFWRTWWLFATPIANAQNLQAEAEAAVTGSWLNVVDAGASGGNAAKYPSATAEPTATVNFPSWIPPAGAYDLYFRLRVTAQNSATNQLQVGVNNVTAASFPIATSYSPNGLPLAYGTPIKVGSFTANGTDTFRAFYQATGAASASTDLFVDEVLFAPKSDNVAGGKLTFPQELFQQAMYERQTEWVN